MTYWENKMESYVLKYQIFKSENFNNYPMALA